MEHRRLGESGLRVSALALGTMVFGEEGARGTPPDVARRLIDTFLGAGGSHIDTADVYAGGRSEEIVGAAIHGRRDEVTLATKVRFRTGDGPNDEGLSRLHVLRAVEASLKRLDTDHVDVLYAHCWDPWTPLDETPDTQTGRIGGTPDHAEEAWARRDRERNWRTLDIVREIAEAHDVTPSQVALAWLLGRPTVSTVLMGVRTPEQLDDDLGAADLRLSEEEQARLDEASAPESRYPYRMIDVYGARD